MRLVSLCVKNKCIDLARSFQLIDTIDLLLNPYKMKRLIVFFLIYGTIHLLTAQTANTQTQSIKFSHTISFDQLSANDLDQSTIGTGNHAYASVPSPLGFKAEGPFYSATLVINNKPTLCNDIIIELAVATKDGLWNEWQVLRETRELPEVNRFISEPIFVDGNASVFKYRVRKAVEDCSFQATELELEWNFFNPGFSDPLDTYPRRQLHSRSIAYNCPFPTYVDRVGWGSPDGNNASCADISFTDVSHLIVHHSATPNESNDWAAVVRSFWNSHVNIRGWCDIGYNWLIDPNGVVYLGRGGGDDVRGAHFCGSNTGTMGVCVIGNFNIAPPTDAALSRLDSVLAWKACEAELQPGSRSLHNASGKVLNIISGHREGCNTSCPGDLLFSQLPDIINSTDSLLQIFILETSNDPALTENITIGPNPLGKYLKINSSLEITDGYDISLTDLLGREVYGTDLRSVIERGGLIDLSYLDKGVYVFRVMGKSGHWSKKVVKN